MPPSQSRAQLSTPDANTQHRLMSHEIRVTESDLRKAQRRRRLSNIAIALGPVLIVILFELHWALQGNTSLSEAIYIPGGILAVFCFIAWVKLKLTPGGSPTRPAGTGLRAHREQESDLELKIARLRDERKVIAADAELDLKVRRIFYRDSAYDDIRTLREESSRYRRVNNLLQAVLIVGSLAATGAAAIIGQYPAIRWVTLGITFTVGMASGFMGYLSTKREASTFSRPPTRLNQNGRRWKLALHVIKNLVSPRLRKGCSPYSQTRYTALSQNKSSASKV